MQAELYLLLQERVENLFLYFKIQILKNLAFQHCFQLDNLLHLWGKVKLSAKNYLSSIEEVTE